MPVAGPTEWVGPHRGSLLRTLATVALAAMAMILSTCSGTTRTPPSVAELLGSGHAAFEQGHDSAALLLFEQAVKTAPSDASAYFDLGAVYQAEGQDRGALEQYRMALRLDPTMVPPLFNEAVIYQARSAPLAIFLYRKVISLQPDSPSALFNLGLLEAQSHADALAGAELRQAVHLDPSLESRIPSSAAPDLRLAPPTGRRRSTSTTSTPGTGSPSPP
jgi:Flp pilus assembly protein TadD